MMTVQKTLTDTVLNLQIKGRIDTTTAPQLETEIKDNITGITELKLDFAEVDYISSAGLRVILSVQKIMNKQGKMTISHVSANVMEVFEITGFTDILTIE